MRTTGSIFFVVALSACSGAGMGSHSAVPDVSHFAFPFAQNRGATNWNVEVGAATDSYALQDVDFYPNKITIDAGDTITYRVNGTGLDGHTVTFVPPSQKIPGPLDPKDLVPHGGTTIDGKKFVNSGVLGGGYPPYEVTMLFSRPGIYRILCLFHEPAMESTIIVQKTGARYPHDAQYYRDIADSEKWHDLAAAERSVSLFPFKPGGTTLAAGVDPGLVRYPPHDSTVLRYVDTRDAGKVAKSGNLKIKVGAVVTFVNETSNEPHTITLPKAGDHKLPNIPPDPPVNAPRGKIAKYDGSQIVNSGTILGGTRFRLMFTKPGSYYYGCLYHDNTGMVGIITVTP
jgi:plastocyanin